MSIITRMRERKAAHEQYKAYVADFGRFVAQYKRDCEELNARRLEDIRVMEGMMLIAREMVKNDPDWS